MNQESVESALKLDCEQRYEYFLSEVVESREIWILVNSENQFLKLFSEDEGYEYLPVWPTSALAAAYVTGADEDLRAKAISLPDFLKKWISGLQRDKLQVSIFPTSTDSTLWLMAPTELQDDLKEELARF